MKAPNSPNTSDADVAIRIASVREMTEAARDGVIGWRVRDRRLRELFSAAISHDILEFSARVLTQWAVSFPNALDA